MTTDHATSARLWTAIAMSLGATAIGVGVALRRRGRAQLSPGVTQSQTSRDSSRGRAQGAIDMSDPTKAYSTAFWGIVMFPYAAQHAVPLAFALAAIAEESGGNPCAIGNPEGYGPDGNPREMGIYQFYNPDDLKLLKLTGAGLRTYCSAERVTYKTKDGRTVLGPSQRVSRLLTAAEVTEQANATIDKIVQSRSYAAHYTAASGIAWPFDGVDFWRLVKLVHGLPGLVNTGIAHVTAHLGRAPISWAEFRHLIESGAVKCDPATEGYRGKDGFGWIFNNAEKATATMPGKAIA